MNRIAELEAEYQRLKAECFRLSFTPYAQTPDGYIDLTYRRAEMMELLARMAQLRVEESMGKIRTVDGMNFEMNPAIDDRMRFEMRVGEAVSKAFGAPVIGFLTMDMRESQRPLFVAVIGFRWWHLPRFYLRRARMIAVVRSSVGDKVQAGVERMPRDVLRGALALDELNKQDELAEARRKTVH